MGQDQHTVNYRKDYLPSEYLIETTELDFELNKASTLVTSTVCYVRNPESAKVTGSLVLDGEDLILKSIRLNNTTLTEQDYILGENSLTILDVPESFTLEIITEIFPDQNSSLDGLYLSNGNYCTQCEAEGFRKITYYLDRPSVLAKFTTRVAANKKDFPVLLSNGNKIETGELDNGRHYAIWRDPFPKPSYLFALVAGDLVSLDDTFITKSGKEVLLQIFVEKRNQEKCQHAMASLKKSMRWDEEVYGLEYDLDIYMIVAVDDFNMGAMENKGLNIFNSKYVLALPETATDQDFLSIESVIAHEYFHNWTGNRVTCRDWFQLSLKEGLTVFRDQEFSADLNSRAVQRINDVKILRDYQFKEDASAMAHPIRPDSYVEINNFYTVTIYNKGAEVIRMIHTLLGKENFRKGMDLYFARHDGQAVTCEDFVLAMEAGSGIDLSRFRNWYRQAGTPTVSVEELWDEEKQTYSVTLTQSCPPTPEKEIKEPFHIPIKFGLLDRNGQEISIPQTGNLLELTEEKQTFSFDKLDHKPTLSILRDFSAPVKIDFLRSREELVFLMKHDSDYFNRWDAAWSLSNEIILEVAEQNRSGNKLSLDPLFSQGFKTLLQDKEADPALIAQAINLPQERYLAQQMETVDVESLHLARNFVKSELAKEHTDLLKEVYNRLNVDEEYSITPETIGKRSLKNSVLDYLAVFDEKDVCDLFEQQYKTSNNMTDTIGVLSSIKDSESSLRKNLFEDFYQRWKKDPLVMDKWFALEANSISDNWLENIEKLMLYPEFSMKNPNKVRSVIGVFANNNHRCFHTADGSGYKFLTEQLIFLNKINPQIASRLGTAFSSWKKYDAKRKELIAEQLDRILAIEGLSKDLYEIISKIR